jgi:hypothetical protein
MSPKELTNLLIALGRAADVVEAIDDPEQQRQRGWDLSQWRYQLVPWGVRFSCRDPRYPSEGEILALLTFNGRTAGVPSEPDRRSSATTVLLFG